MEKKSNDLLPPFSEEDHDVELVPDTEFTSHTSVPQRYTTGGQDSFIYELGQGSLSSDDYFEPADELTLRVESLLAEPPVLDKKHNLSYVDKSVQTQLVELAIEAEQLSCFRKTESAFMIDKCVQCTKMKDEFDSTLISSSDILPQISFGESLKETSIIPKAEPSENIKVLNKKNLSVVDFRFANKILKSKSNLKSQINGSQTSATKTIELVSCNKDVSKSPNGALNNINENICSQGDEKLHFTDDNIQGEAMPEWFIKDMSFIDEDKGQEHSSKIDDASPFDLSFMPEDGFVYGLKQGEIQPSACTDHNSLRSFIKIAKLPAEIQQQASQSKVLSIYNKDKSENVSENVPYMLFYPLEKFVDSIGDISRIADVSTQTNESYTAQQTGISPDLSVGEQGHIIRAMDFKLPELYVEQQSLELQTKKGSAAELQFSSPDSYFKHRSLEHLQRQDRHAKPLPNNFCRTFITVSSSERDICHSENTCESSVTHIHIFDTEEVENGRACIMHMKNCTTSVIAGADGFTQFDDQYNSATGNIFCQTLISANSSTTDMSGLRNIRGTSVTHIHIFETKERESREAFCTHIIDCPAVLNSSRDSSGSYLDPGGIGASEKSEKINRDEAILYEFEESDVSNENQSSHLYEHGGAVEKIDPENGMFSTDQSRTSSFIEIGPSGMTCSNALHPNNAIRVKKNGLAFSTDMFGRIVLFSDFAPVKIISSAVQSSSLSTFVDNCLGAVSGNQHATQRVPDNKSNSSGTGNKTALTSGSSKHRVYSSKKSASVKASVLAASKKSKQSAEKKINEASKKLPSLACHYRSTAKLYSKCLQSEAIEGRVNHARKKIILKKIKK